MATKPPTGQYPAEFHWVGRPPSSGLAPAYHVVIGAEGSDGFGGTSIATKGPMTAIDAAAMGWTLDTIVATMNASLATALEGAQTALASAETATTSAQAEATRLTAALATAEAENARLNTALAAAQTKAT